MKKTCIWTNLETERVKEVTIKTTNRFGGGVHEKKVYVLPEHEQQLRQFNEHIVRYGKLFLIIVLSLPLLPLILAGFLFLDFITGKLILVATGVVTICLGITIIVFPFSTPETGSIFGLNRAIKITKITGGIVALLGIGFLWI